MPIKEIKLTVKDNICWFTNQGHENLNWIPSIGTFTIN